MISNGCVSGERRMWELFPLMKVRVSSQLERNPPSFLKMETSVPLNVVVDLFREEKATTRLRKTRGADVAEKLSDETLNKRLVAIKKDLCGVWEGILPSERREQYMKGGYARRILDFSTNLSLLAKGQEDVIMCFLVSNFPCDTVDKMDFTMRVMMFEAVKRVFSQASWCTTVSPSPCRPVSPSSHRPVSPSSHRPVSPSPCTTVSPSPCRPVSPSSHRPVSPSSHRPVSPSPCRPVSPSPCRPLSPSPCRPVSPSPCRPVSPSPCRPVLPSSCRPVSPSPCRYEEEFGASSSAYESESDEWKPPIRKKRRKHSASTDFETSLEAESTETHMEAEHSESDLFDKKKESSRLPRDHCSEKLHSPKGHYSDKDTEGARTWTNPQRRQRPRQRRQLESAKRHRPKVKCPVKGCTGSTVNMPRHLRDMHPDMPEFDVREDMKKRKGSPKRKYPIFNCSYVDCSWKGTRPDVHMVNKHHTSKEVAKIHTQQLKRETVEDKEIYNLGKDMYTAESLSDDFLQWYQSVEGGHFVPESMETHKKKEKVNQNRRSKKIIKTILEVCIGTKPFHSSCLSLLKSLGRSVNGKPSVVEQLKEGRTWGTVKNYLNMFTHFINFLDGKPELLDKSSIAMLRVNTSGSIHTVTKFALEELQKRKIRDRKKVVEFEHITKYLKMGVAKNLSNRLSELNADGADCDPQTAHRIAKHLLLQLEIQNGKRTGVFSDLNCSEVQQGEEKEEGYVILVAEGKTFRTSGSANIFLSHTEFELLQHYISVLRPVFKPSTDQVFCRPSGERATVHEIGDFVKDAWADFGAMIAADVGDITCTLLRKTLITKSREEGVEESEKEVMATHMDHLKNTANRYYDVSTGTRMTVQFRNIFNKFYDPISDSSEDGESEDEVVNMKVEAIPKPRQLVLPATESSSFGHGITFGKSDVFSENDKKRIQRVCKHIIKKGRTKEIIVRKELIKAAIHSAGQNFRDLLQTYSLQQICNRVRCEIRSKAGF